MSLTSYRAAPPRGDIGEGDIGRGIGVVGEWPGGGGVAGGVGEPGGDLLFRRLSGSTIGAEGFHGRVRDGIGCLAPRCGHQAGQAPRICCPWDPWEVLAVPRGFDTRGSGRGGICEGDGEGSVRMAGRGRAPPNRIWGGACRCTRTVFRLSLKDSCPEESSGSGGFERLVPVGCGDYSLSTSGLSTWWSSTALDETWF